MAYTDYGQPADPLSAPSHSAWAGDVAAELDALHAADAAHAAAADPHPGYLTDSHTTDADPHPGYLLESAVGNLLTANQASVETDLTGFGLAAGSLATIGRVADPAHGAQAVQVAATGNGHFGFNVLDAPIRPGALLTFATTLKQSVARQVNLNIFYKDAAGTVLGSSGAFAWSSAGTATYKELRHTWTVPTTWPTAVKASFEIKTISGLAGETLTCDKFGLWAGAGGQWAMPGTPITGLGTQVTHPNTDDVLAQVWDAGKARWQTVRYDSGWRRVAYTDSGALPNWTGGSIYLRRVGDRVVIEMDSVKLGALTGDTTLYTLPTGFKARPIPTGYSLRENALTGTLHHAFVIVASAGKYWVPPAGFTHNPTGHTFAGTAVVTTDDAVPTTLPGVLASAAPAYAFPGSLT